MATVTITLPEPLADKLAELVGNYQADVRCGAVTGFAWTEEEELDELREILTAIDNAKVDANG